MLPISAPSSTPDTSPISSHVLFKRVSVVITAFVTALIIACFALASPALNDSEDLGHSRTSGNLKSFVELPLAFETNMGQAPDGLLYVAHSSGGTLFFGSDHVTIATYAQREAQSKAVPAIEAEQNAGGASALAAAPGDALLQSITGHTGMRERPAFSTRSTISTELTTLAQHAQPSMLKTSTITMRFLGISHPARVASAETLPGVVNYMMGNDPDKWILNVPTSAEIRYDALYPGISLTYDGAGGALKGTYNLDAGVRPELISWRYEGADSVKVDGGGNLQISSQSVPGQPAGEQVEQVTITEHAPVAWQEINGERVNVEVSYQVEHDGSVQFALTQYDPSYPLVIDPYLTYSTWLGGSAYDEIRGIAVDSDGSVYVAGVTASTNLPTLDPFQATNAGFDDIFVAKINAQGTALIYSTYLGGANSDIARGLAIDTAGAAYITGYTSSFDFPLQNAYQSVVHGSRDAFVTKLGTTGSSLAYSTYLGGGSSDEAAGIAVDNAGYAFVTGSTASSDFPVLNAFQPTSGGGWRVLIGPLYAPRRCLVHR